MLILFLIVRFFCVWDFHDADMRQRDCDTGDTLRID